MEETLVAIVRSFITFFSLLIYARLLGKQQMGNLSFFDYINGITIGSIGAGLATDLSTKAWVHWVGLTTFIVIALVLQLLGIKFRSLAKAIDSEPIIVVQDGAILESNLEKMRVTKDELMVLLRQKEVFNLTHVQYAVMEPNGKISVLLKGQYRKLTPNDLNLRVNTGGLSTDLIYDGTIQQENLQQKGKDVYWLLDELSKEGISHIKNISYAALLPNNQLYIDLYEDELDEGANVEI
ncbi:DUF421 domain-containing protein [Bacillus solimangrovi]|uniref:YetF C-terminal domain-containing protein n=1 Tax=Bacillus solimangrovi TaxID=1305675 RepID=A0A1E5LIY3_9BACI|nr:DUF421 domain-containing protein [Bacillus solimangrovi]OEH94053.1 hypothetical protein BFG57_10295 [Bacillus solimangrovi]